MYLLVQYYGTDHRLGFRSHYASQITAVTLSRARPTSPWEMGRSSPCRSACLSLVAPSRQLRFHCSLPTFVMQAMSGVWTLEEELRAGKATLPAASANSKSHHVSPWAESPRPALLCTVVSDRKCGKPCRLHVFHQVPAAPSRRLFFLVRLATIHKANPFQGSK